MRLFRSTILVTFITVIALLYVHQQIELVKLSYAIGLKEKKLKDILDHNEGLGYNIDNLEAPSRLEQVLFAKNIDIDFPKRGQVVDYAKPASGYRSQNQARQLGLRKIDFFGIFEFFSPRAEAQAK